MAVIEPSLDFNQAPVAVTIGAETTAILMTLRCRCAFDYAQAPVAVVERSRNHSYTNDLEV
jgi:hypothetical protein